MQNLINQYRKHVKAVIRKITGSESEDLEQEVYIKVWQNQEKYKNEGKLRQWICAVAANVCRDSFRSGAAKAKKREISDENILQNMSVNPHPEERIDRRKRQKIILKAVDSLPDIYRKVIVLSEFEDCSLNDIAEKLKIPLGTVKSRIHKAKEILKTNLKDLLGEDK